MNFDVATDFYNEDTRAMSDKPQWVRISLWGEQAERIAQWATKGRSVSVGIRSLRTVQWEKDGKSGYSTKATAIAVDFNDSPSDRPENVEAQAPVAGTDLPF